jgi:hypothetical protein
VEALLAQALGPKVFSPFLQQSNVQKVMFLSGFLVVVLVYQFLIKVSCYYQWRIFLHWTWDFWPGSLLQV